MTVQIVWFYVLSPNVSTGSLFTCISRPFVFCARSRRTSKKKRKGETGEFHNQIALLTMFEVIIIIEIEEILTCAGS